jgi:hypothetical protein
MSFFPATQMNCCRWQTDSHPPQPGESAGAA